MNQETKLFLVGLVLAVGIIANCQADIKKDPLLPGNRRLDMHESACEGHDGIKDAMNLFTCEEFVCGDDTTVPVPHGTPCKLIVDFGHCLNGQCLHAHEYLDAMRTTTQSPEEK